MVNAQLQVGGTAGEAINDLQNQNVTINAAVVAAQYAADSAASVAATAYQAASDATGQVVYSTSQPFSPNTGQLWVDTSGSPPLLKMWSGSTWLVATFS